MWRPGEEIQRVPLSRCVKVAFAMWSVFHKSVLILRLTCLCSPLWGRNERLLLGSLQKTAGHLASFSPFFRTLHLFPNFVGRQRQCCRFSNMGCCASDCLPGSPFLAQYIELVPRFWMSLYMWKAR